MGYLLPQEGMGRKVRTNAGVPSAGTTEVQTLTIGGTPDGGTFRLGFKGQYTAPIEWTATDATLVAAIDTALGALSTIGGASNITVADTTITNGIGAVSVTFAGSLVKLNVPTITVESNDLTGTSPTVAVTVATPGVTATHRGAPTGALLIDTTNGVEYYNTGTVYAPIWTATDGTLSSALLADLTPGTVAASKAVVVDANKDAASFRNLAAVAVTSPTVTATNVDAGASGTAGTVDVFPTTASKGKLAISVTDQAGDTTVGLVIGAMAAARTITLADPLAAADILTGKMAAVARTATVAGATTGTIADAGLLQFVAVTASDAAHQIILPTPTPGRIVILYVGATGFKLKSSAPASVAINGGTGAAAVSAVAANMMAVLICTSATSWHGFTITAATLAALPAAA